MIEPVLSDEAFIADIEAARNQSGLHLWWLGQSGYLIQTQGLRLLIDPYLSDSLTKKYGNSNKPHVRMSRRVVDPSHLRGIDMITVSHAHTDHLDAETLSAIRAAHGSEPPMLLAPRATEQYVLDRWGERADVWMDDGTVCSWDDPDISVRAVPAIHEPRGPTETGHHPCLGYVFHICPFYVYHSGDTLNDVTLVHRFKVVSEQVDVAILPINGKLNNMNGQGAARLAKAISAKLVIPCHYDMFEFNTADPYEQFVPECERLGQPYRVLKLGERFTYPAEKTS